MKKKYVTPVFEEIKYNSEDVLLISDNTLIDYEDPTGIGGMEDID